MTEKSSLEGSGRGGGIRTRDPLHPMQVRYQAALRPDRRMLILHQFSFFGNISKYSRFSNGSFHLYFFQYTGEE